MPGQMLWWGLFFRPKSSFREISPSPRNGGRYIFVLFVFFINSIGPLPQAQADELRLPAPGVMVHLSPGFTPPHLQGLTLHPENPLKFDFLIDKGDESLGDLQKKEEYKKLVKYFLASLTIPDEDQWVNLSPYEKDRIIKDNFGKTEMGRDLLAQDYILKQITSSLIYPEDRLGKKFWDRVYQRAWKELGTTNVPVNTFNKVWIVPDEAAVYESGNTVYVLRNHLKVMLEEDYLSLQKHSSPPLVGGVRGGGNNPHAIASQIVREIILPELEREVNEGQNFANLRQIYSGMILATWYKHELKESLLGKIYANQAKVAGLVIPAPSSVIPAKAGIQSSGIDAIYQRYLQAFKKGVFNYIKEDMDKYSNEAIPRKYFSGGARSFDGVIRPPDGAMTGFIEGKVVIVKRGNNIGSLHLDPQALSAERIDRATIALTANGEMVSETGTKIDAAMAVISGKDEIDTQSVTRNIKLRLLVLDDNIKTAKDKLKRVKNADPLKKGIERDKQRKEFFNKILQLLRNNTFLQQIIWEIKKDIRKTLQEKNIKLAALKINITDIEIADFGPPFIATIGYAIQENEGKIDVPISPDAAMRTENIEMRKIKHDIKTRLEILNGEIALKRDQHRYTTGSDERLDLLAEIVRMEFEIEFFTRVANLLEKKRFAFDLESLLKKDRRRGVRVILRIEPPSSEFRFKARIAYNIRGTKGLGFMEMDPLPSYDEVATKRIDVRGINEQIGAELQKLVQRIQAIKLDQIKHIAKIPTRASKTKAPLVGVIQRLDFAIEFFSRIARLLNQDDLFVRRILKFIEREDETQGQKIITKIEPPKNKFDFIATITYTINDKERPPIEMRLPPNAAMSTEDVREKVMAYEDFLNAKGLLLTDGERTDLPDRIQRRVLPSHQTIIVLDEDHQANAYAGHLIQALIKRENKVLILPSSADGILEILVKNKPYLILAQDNNQGMSDLLQRYALQVNSNIPVLYYPNLDYSGKSPPGQLTIKPNLSVTGNYITLAQEAIRAHQSQYPRAEFPYRRPYDQVAFYTSQAMARIARHLGFNTEAGEYANNLVVAEMDQSGQWKISDSSAKYQLVDGHPLKEGFLPVQIKEGMKIIAISPHSDDPEIALFNVILRSLIQGADVYNFIYSTGHNGVDNDDPIIRKFMKEKGLEDNQLKEAKILLREQEAMQASKILQSVPGARGKMFVKPLRVDLKPDDRKLKSMVDALEPLIEEHKRKFPGLPVVVGLPHTLDEHKTHQEATKYALEALSKLAKKHFVRVQLLFYLAPWSGDYNAFFHYPKSEDLHVEGEKNYGIRNILDPLSQGFAYNTSSLTGGHGQKSLSPKEMGGELVERFRRTVLTPNAAMSAAQQKVIYRLEQIGGDSKLLAQAVKADPKHWSFIWKNPFLTGAFWLNGQARQNVSAFQKRRRDSKEYVDQLKSHIPDIYQFSRWILDQPKYRGKKIVVLGKAADPIYDTLVALSYTHDAYRNRQSDIALIDFSATLMDKKIEEAGQYGRYFREQLYRRGASRNFDNVVFVQEVSHFGSKTGHFLRNFAGDRFELVAGFRWEDYDHKVGRGYDGRKDHWEWADWLDTQYDSGRRYEIDVKRGVAYNRYFENDTLQRWLDQEIIYRGALPTGTSQNAAMATKFDTSRINEKIRLRILRLDKRLRKARLKRIAEMMVGSNPIIRDPVARLLDFQNRLLIRSAKLLGQETIAHRTITAIEKEISMNTWSSKDQNNGSLIDIWRLDLERRFFDKINESLGRELFIRSILSEIEKKYGKGLITITDINPIRFDPQFTAMIVYRIQTPRSISITDNIERKLPPDMPREIAQLALSSTQKEALDTGKVIPLNRAMTSPGGIDLNSANLNLLIKRDSHGMPLPLIQQNIGQLMQIQGLVPVILEIKPAANLPILSELQKRLQPALK